MPTVRRDELESDDIVAEVGVVRMRKDRMDGPPTGTIASQCDGKKRHDSYADARAFGKHFSNLITYRCRHCNGWHNGNRNGR